VSQPDVRRVELALAAEAQARARSMRNFQKSTTTPVRHTPPQVTEQSDEDRITDVVDDLMKSTAKKAGLEPPEPEPDVDLSTIFDDDPNVDTTLKSLGKTQVTRELR
jgi:hypothetical protein